jgi:hypothetical protein
MVGVSTTDYASLHNLSRCSALLMPQEKRLPASIRKLAQKVKGMRPNGPVILKLPSIISEGIVDSA